MSKLQTVKMTTVLLALALLMSVGGVFAAWVYPTSTLGASTLVIVPAAFSWEGSDILPDDNQNVIGENHVLLIDNILFEANYGLNATNKPVVHNTLNKVGDILYCQQNVQGGNLKNLMIDGTDSYALLFQVEYVSDNEYKLYTYSRLEVSNAANGSRIEVFFTDLKTNDAGVWQAVKSTAGTAVVIDPRVNKVSGAINSSTFTKK